jgi:6-phosphogluconolactonase
MAISFTKAQTFTLLVGTYTGSGSKGIYVYRFNAANGTATLLNNTDSIVNPSYLAISKDQKYVYAVNETGNGKGSASAFAFNKANGELGFLNSQLTDGDHPCYVSVDKNNKWVIVGNYSGGNLSVFPVEENGSLKPHAQLIQDIGSGVNKSRQEKAHVHSAVFSPDERFVFTPDLGLDRIMIYTFNPSSEEPLKPADPAFAESEKGHGPRHFTFHPNGKYAYLIEELSGTVTAFKYDNGKLNSFQNIPTHPKDYKGEIGSADIHISPDGKFLYASNRGDENTITIFSIDAATGELTLKGYQSTMGKTPRNFAIDPTGNYLLAANQDTDNIVIFKIDKQTGLLKATGKEINVPKPVCVKLIE